MIQLKAISLSTFFVGFILKLFACAQFAMFTLINFSIVGLFGEASSRIWIAFALTI